MSDISSDDTIILTPERNTNEVDIDTILKKYSSGENYSKPLISSFDEFSDEDFNQLPLIERLNAPKVNKVSENVVVELSDSESEKQSTNSSPKHSNFEEFVNDYKEENVHDVDPNYRDNFIKQLYAKYEPKKIESDQKTESDKKTFLGSFSDKENDTNLNEKYGISSTQSSNLSEDGTTKGKKRKSNNLDKEQRKLEKEAKLVEKQQEKDRKKLEAENKKKEAAKQKELKEALKNVDKNLKPDECIKLVNVDVKEVEEDQVLFFMNLKEFLVHINEETLTAHIDSILSCLQKIQLTLSVYGLTKYLNYLRNKKNNEFKSNVVGETSSKHTKCHKSYEDFPHVSMRTIENALCELQISNKIYFRPLETLEDVSLIVTECTKAVAQRPYKLKTQEKYKMKAEFFAGDNKDCVQVDKNGNGLSRLWNQILTMFPLARLETAEAIASVYPTPITLWEAYEKCANEDEGEKLIQDIPIRRAAGPLTTNRKIGPEMSKKIYNFFCSQEDILL